MPAADRGASVRSAHRACGHDGPPQRTRFDADEAVRALRRFGAAHGHPPTVRQWDESWQRPSAAAIIRHFGAWNAALAAAGLSPTRHARRWSDEQIFAAIREYEARYQRPPSALDYGAGAMLGFETVRVRSDHSPWSSNALERRNPADPQLRPTLTGSQCLGDRSPLARAVRPDPRRTGRCMEAVLR